MELIPGSETSTLLIQTPGKYPEDNTLHQQHGESLKTRNDHVAQAGSKIHSLAWSKRAAADKQVNWQPSLAAISKYHKHLFLIQTKIQKIYFSALGRLY
jgi:hypothetical protein